MTMDKTKVIHFIVGDQQERAEFSESEPTDQIREIFQSAAEAGPYDILKLYNEKHNLINISPHLAANTPTSPYRLEVIATHCDGHPSNAAFSEIIGAMENRIELLERKLLCRNADLPPVVREMVDKVDSFKSKLENVEHLSWLGLTKDISRGPELHLFWNKQTPTRKNEAHAKKTYEKFLKMSQIEMMDEVKDYLKKPSFDNWQWDDPEMILLLRQMFIDLNFVNRFKIEMPVLHKWLYTIYRNYNEVPFHNFKHCFMVTQMMYGLTWLINLPKYMEEMEVLALITSAICHDLDHPGYNNAYQINAKTELAIRYNDISPLENHHCSSAFEILEDNSCNIFRNLSCEQYKHLRELMIKCILSTDMAKHSEVLSDFRSVLTTFDFTNRHHRNLLMMILIKVADISNEARPLDVAMPWLDCLLQEFFNQLSQVLVKVADISNECRPLDVAEPWLECLLSEFFNQSDVEKLEGLPVAPFMDREKVTKSSSQIGFIKFVMLPLFESLATLFPVIEEHVILPIRYALDYYTDMQNALDAQKKRDNNNSNIANNRNVATT